jgi:hypothetical protein
MRPLIATSIRAGLGNQMFQYAIARRLALKAKGELVLVLEGPEQYRLSVFSISGREVAFGAALTPARRFFPRRARPAPEIPLIQEKSVWDLIGQFGPQAPAGQEMLYTPNLLQWRGHALLRGYWQNERYFADIRPRILRDFSLKRALDARSQQCLARIHAGPSAFFHIRRGDYLLPKFIDRYGVCTAEYYHRALEMLRARVPGVKIFVFSDDPAWAAANAIGGAGAEIIDWNIDTPEHDLALMQACTHAVIANSSFSWWGAWLGERPESITIAPRTWYKILPEYREIVPERWLRLENAA